MGKSKDNLNQKTLLSNDSVEKTHGKKKWTIEAIQQENKRRNEILFKPYNPITGEGSLLPRKEINLRTSGVDQVQRWPNKMFELKPVKELAKHGLPGLVKKINANADEGADPVTINDLTDYYFNLRIKYDYEFWGFTCATIKNNKGKEVPFLFNLSQRKSIADREKLRAEGVPVWQLEFKDRQYGSSTEKNAYIFWRQNVVFKNHNSYIISLDKDVVSDIVERYERIAKNYPKNLNPVVLKSYRGSKNTLRIDGQESFIYMGSVERPNAGSGRTVQHALISEAGKMKETDVKSAEELMTNIISLVPEEPYTTLLIESTAHRSGKWFRKECQKALRGESGYHLTFINWLTNPNDKWNATLRIGKKKAKSLSDFLDSFSDYDWQLWEVAGASLEQINWYRIRAMKYPNDWQMKQENPTWPEEAFQTTEQRYYPVHYVKNLEKYVKEPVAIGNITSDAQEGKDAFKNIRFERQKEGRIWIWKWPWEIGISEKEKQAGLLGYRNQTVGAFDVGGRAATSDKCAGTIKDRFAMMDGGDPEVVAEYRGNLDLDLFAWEAAKLSYWYHQALLAIEVNTIINKEAREGTYEGEGHLAIMNELNGVYPNLYSRTMPENRDSGKPLKKLGFHMNRYNKQMIYTSHLAAARDVGYIERSSRAIHEMNVFVQYADGSIGAMDGEKDDLLDTRALAYWLATDHMGEVSPIYKIDNSSGFKQRTTEAVF